MHRYIQSWSTSAAGPTEKLLREVKADLTKAAPDSIVEVVGSFLLRTTLATSFTADVCVAMDDSVCSVEDLEALNYIDVRSKFIAKVHGALTKKGAYASVETSDFCHDTQCPVVVVKHGGATVRILARPSRISGRVASEKNVAKHPYYTQCALRDHAMPSVLRYLHTKTQDTVFARASLFFKAWLEHRGLTGVPGCVTPFQVQMMLAKLYDDNLLTHGSGEAHVARTFFAQLVRDYFATPKEKSSSPFPYTLAFEGNLNVLHTVTSAGMREVVAAAKEALQLPKPDDVFAHAPQLLHERFDMVLRVDGLAAATKKDLDFPPTRAIRDSVQRVVEEALGSRCQRAVAWMLPAAADATTFSAAVAVTVTNEVDGRSRLTRGPAIDEEAAVEAFNTFWGKDVVTSRQFADGAVYRCVVWNPTEPNSVSCAITTILDFACKRNLAASGVEDLEGSVAHPLKEFCAGRWCDAAAVVSDSLKRASEEFRGLVMKIGSSSLPCKVTSVEVISPADRGTEVFPVRPHLTLLGMDSAVPDFVSTRPSVDPLHTVVTIDDKQKIPNTMEAIQKTKGALIAQLASTIERSAPGVICFPTASSLDVVFRGYLFALHIAHYREVSVLKLLQRDQEAAVVERKLFCGASHAKFVRSVADQYASYCASTRLVKRWLGAHLLTEYVLEEAVELIVAYVYTAAPAGCAPRTPARALLASLRLLATYDWDTAALVLPGVDDTKGANLARQRFEATPAPIMWISAPYLPEASPFTLNTPRAVILERIRGLAGASVALYHDNLRAAVADAPAWAPMYSFDRSAFDVVIPIPPAFAVHRDRPVEMGADPGAPSALVHRKVWRLDELGSDRVEKAKYLNHLVEFEAVATAARSVRAALRTTAMVFYDSYGPSALATVLLASDPTPDDIAECEATMRKAGGALLGGAPAAGAAGPATPKATRLAAKKKKTAAKAAPVEVPAKAPKRREKQPAAAAPKKTKLRRTEA